MIRKKPQGHTLINSYLRGLYARTMREAYALARQEAVSDFVEGWTILDCGADDGGNFETLRALAPITAAQYHGMEWSPDLVRKAQDRGLNVRQGDLNQPLPLDDQQFDCVLGLSVLEHLLNGCQFIVEARRILKPGGKLVILTPNISTYFTIALLLAGRMPSTGPHPDSNQLIKAAVSLNMKDIEGMVEGDHPTHRHLVVFSFRTLREFLGLAGFESITGRGFGLYPFPNFLQRPLERLDPWHCHQMVFTARKPA